MKVKCALLIIVISLVLTHSIYAANPDENCPDAAYKAMGLFLKKDNFYPQNDNTKTGGKGSFKRM